MSGNGGKGGERLICGKGNQIAGLSKELLGGRGITINNQFTAKKKNILQLNNFGENQNHFHRVLLFSRFFLQS